MDLIISKDQGQGQAKHGHQMKMLTLKHACDTRFRVHSDTKFDVAIHFLFDLKKGLRHVKLGQISKFTIFAQKCPFSPESP